MSAAFILLIAFTNDYKQDNGESGCATISTKLTDVILTLNNLMLILFFIGYSHYRLLSLSFFLKCFCCQKSSSYKEADMPVCCTTLNKSNQPTNRQIHVHRKVAMVFYL